MKPRTRPVARLFALAILGACALFLGDPPGATARGGAPQPAGDPDHIIGKRHFEQAVAWVNDGKPGINNVTDFYADLEDVQFNLDQNHHEGYMRLWFREPDKYRWELRPRKELVGMTTKILDGQRLWIVNPNNTVQRLHGTPDGAGAIRQLQNDRKRLSDLARFLTLEGLKGPGVRFKFEGPTTGSDTYAGAWLKVRRLLPGAGDILFYLAYQPDPRDPTGQTVTATWPGVVTVPGDPARKEPTESYVLRSWKRGPQFRYPGKIEAYSQRAGQPRPVRFLLAFPKDIRINTNLPAETFAEPK